MKKVLILILILLSSLIIINVKAIPYDSWNNYKVLNFNEGFEGLQVNFNVTYGYGDNGLSFNCQEDFEDLRFFNYDNDELLSAYNETTVNSDYVEIWLKLGDSKNVTMRYNNPYAESYWDIDAVFEDVIPNVVLALPMDEGSGSTVYDYSGNENDGSVTGSEVVESPFFEGEYARLFNGTTDYVTVSDSVSLNGFSEITVLCWVNASALGDIPHMSFILKGLESSGLTDAFWVWYNTNPNQLQFKMNVDVSGYSSGSNHFMANSPMYVGGWYDGSNVEVLLNGEKNGTTSPSVSGDINDVAQDLLIGKGVSSKFVNGVVGHVSIFSIALTELELENMYSFYPDSTIIEGSVCCRVWADVMPTVIFGLEISNLNNDIMLVAIFALIIGFTALLLVITKKK